MKKAIQNKYNRMTDQLGIRSPSQEALQQHRPAPVDDFYTSCRKIQWLIDSCKLDIGEAVMQVETLSVDLYDAAKIILIKLKQIQQYAVDRQKLNEEY